MAQQPSRVDLARLSLSYGGAASLDVPVPVATVELGGQDYLARPNPVEARLDVSRTSSGYALRLRLAVELEGPCQRCLDPARLSVDVDAREVDQAGTEDEELRSPYVDGGELDAADWAHDAITLALPGKILCRENCAGLCPVCGQTLNDADPEEHRHGSAGDPRWAKLRELSE